VEFLSDLPDDKRASVLAAVLVIGLALLVGLFMISWLMRTWRRHTDRLNRAADRDATMPDIWKESGDRLLAKMSPYPRGSGGSDAHLDHDFDDDPPTDDSPDEFDDDDDDPARW